MNTFQYIISCFITGGVLLLVLVITYNIFSIAYMKSKVKKYQFIPDLWSYWDAVNPFDKENEGIVKYLMLIGYCSIIVPLFVYGTIFITNLLFS